MTSIQIINQSINQKLNAIQCLCGFIGRNHQCEKTIQGQIIFGTCSEECSKCCEQIKRDKYNEEQWATDRDGHLICGTCYENILVKFAQTVFVKYVMFLLKNGVTVFLNNFFLENEMPSVWIKLFN